MTAYYSHQVDRAIREYRRRSFVALNDLTVFMGSCRAYAQKNVPRSRSDTQTRRGFDGRIVPPVILIELGYVYGLSDAKKKAHETIDGMQALENKIFVRSIFLSRGALFPRELDQTFARLEMRPIRFDRFPGLGYEGDPKGMGSMDDPAGLQAMLRREKKGFRRRNDQDCWHHRAGGPRSKSASVSCSLQYHKALDAQKRCDRYG